MSTSPPDDPIEAAPLSDSLRALARRGISKKYRKGVLLISEGDIGDTLHIVLQGRLRAYSVDADGREVTYGDYGPGEYVGEMGLDGGPRSANVETATPTLCVMITRSALQAHLQAEPEFAFELLSKVIWRARTATHNLRQVSLNNVYGRLKALLESVTQPAGSAPALAPGAPRVADPAPSHKEISQSLGCSREMVSRVMKDLEKGGYVEVGRRRIVLLKPLPAKW